MKLMMAIVLAFFLTLSVIRASPVPQGRPQGLAVTTNTNAQQQSNAQLMSQVQNSNQGLAAALISSTFAMGQQVFQAVGRQLQGWSRL
ncbi:hypothetical protein OUZ56_030981 [Daphnia magna]|uniref:Uncharacterized protein n=1 Tax=Daphnia magna TaxID=35525 RepID=A0ABQ9ZSW0_9CRUS|nr:hypothetical protein OUZ56_030981 [Daphnia magna]